MSYPPIEDHGIIGNMHTAVLVDVEGTIDWYCYPRFDSPSVFGSILDHERGGFFRISPTVSGTSHRQFYWPDTNILVTRFLSDDGIAEVTDFMPVGLADDHFAHGAIIRKVSSIRGNNHIRLQCSPAFDYGRQDHHVEYSEAGVWLRAGASGLFLESEVPLESHEGVVYAEFIVPEGQSTAFILRPADRETPSKRITSEGVEELFTKTVKYWRRWLAQCTYTGRWREMVHRSALCLKLLTYEPTGALVAAPTTSLPESLGGERNWDYRYTWIRDAAFTLYALMRIGFTEEAGRFMHWLEARCHEPNADGSLQIMYGIDGRHRLDEEVLEHLEGYQGSRPVRIGNGAYDQLQLDIYGELLDSVYLYNKYGSPISHDLWTHLRRLVDWVCDNWRLEDEGIWEVRGGRRRFVYSALMCWVAVDRGLRLANKRSFPCDRFRWEVVRDAIYEEIMERGWNKELEAFVQSYDSDVLDASNLIMPLVFFVSPSDPRMMKTLQAINRPPEQGGLVSNSLVFRYDVTRSPDGLSGEEGSFNLCTFWLVEALTRAGQTDPEQLRNARLMFEQMLGYANHLGLYAEETGHRGEALGNFPQAFTHLALISAAFNLDRALGRSDR